MITRDNNPLPLFTFKKESLYDLSRLEQMGDGQYLRDVINIFLTETYGEVRKMRLALKVGVADKVVHYAHKMKSIAGIIRALTLLDLLDDIESIAAKGIITNELTILVALAELKCSKIEYALRMHIILMNN